MEFVNMLVTGVMDAMEEFFASLTAPSTKFTFNAFIYSLIFLGASVAAELFEIPCFVQWQEALACSLLMGVIVMIDTSVRGNIKDGLSKLKSATSRFTYSGENEEYEDSQEEMEVYEDGSSE